MKTSSRPRRSKFSEAFKRDAVALTEEKSINTVAKELGISYSALARWKQQRRSAMSSIGQ